MATELQIKARLAISGVITALATEKGFAMKANMNLNKKNAFVSDTTIHIKA